MRGADSNFRPLRFFSVAFISLFGVLLPTAGDAQQAFSIVGNEAISQGQSASFSVEMTNTAPVEGLVVVVGFDEALVTVTEVTTDGTVLVSSGAELIVPEILPNGWTLGVVLDSAAPFEAQTVPVGTDQEIARFTVRADGGPPAGGPDLITGFEFVDGALNNPPLSNILVQGGESVGLGSGLSLFGAPAALSIGPPPPVEFFIEDTTLTGDGAVRVLMNNFAGPTAGFVVVVTHDPGVLMLTDISLDGTDTNLQLPEFSVPAITATGGSFAVVLDFSPPFDGQTIPVGANRHLVSYEYDCVNPPTFTAGEAEPPPVLTDLFLSDGVLGSPVLDNVVVVDGQSISPQLTGGVVSCAAIPIVVGDTQFFCGPPDLPLELDPAAPVPPPLMGDLGETIDLCFFYVDPSDNLQGLQVAICHDCDLTFANFSIAGSIFDEVGAEFVSASYDADPNDGDGCEFAAGILLDALPPFDAQTVPPTSVPLLIGCVEVTIEPTAECGEFLAVEFCDGINAGGEAVLENIVITNFASVQNFPTFPCPIEVTPEEILQRGDCNSDDKVDLADAATVLGWQFHGISILCPDACDVNDDGFINLADSVQITAYLFMGGTPPADPGPIDGLEGPDPTADGLGDCLTGDGVCP